VSPVRIQNVRVKAEKIPSIAGSDLKFPSAIWIFHLQILQESAGNTALMRFDIILIVAADS